MSRFFTAVACALTLMGPAAFAQTSMNNGMSNGTAGAMSSESMSKPTDAMKPAANMKPADSMSKPTDAMAQSSSMGNSMSSPSSNSMSHPAQ